MMLTTRFAGACLALGGLLAACNHSLDGNKSVNADATVTGIVQDENGVGIANVKLAVGTDAAAATTAADGTYVAKAKGAVGATLPVSLIAAGHANATSSIYLDGLAVQHNFVLRPYDVTQTVTLPADATSPPATVTASKAGADVVLSLTAGSLRKADGTLVTGDVQVSLTTWPAGNSNDNGGATAAESLPAPLVGVLSDASINATSLRDLFTLGMADIEITQGADALQVVPGKWLELNFKLSDSFAAMAASYKADDVGAPALWYADHAVGAWRRTDDVFGNANIGFAASSNSIVARIPHLSAWNIDGISTPNGCAKGTAIDGCTGKPMAAAKLTLWLYGDGDRAKGSLSQYEINTKADGTFCTSLIGSVQNGGTTNLRSGEGYVWMSAFSDPNSAACNPTGKATFGSLCPGRDPDTASGCNRDVIPDAAFAKCNIPARDITLCGYCDGTSDTTGCIRSRNGDQFTSPVPKTAGQCTDLGQIKVGSCGSPNTPAVCLDAKNPVKQGSGCSSTPECCAPGVLECADARCVPVKK